MSGCVMGDKNLPIMQFSTSQFRYCYQVMSSGSPMKLSNPQNMSHILDKALMKVVVVTLVILYCEMIQKNE